MEDLNPLANTCELAETPDVVARIVDAEAAILEFWPAAAKDNCDAPSSMFLLATTHSNMSSVPNDSGEDPSRPSSLGLPTMGMFSR